MYTSEIKEQLLEASDVLTNFLNNENNLKAIQTAAELIAESLKEITTVYQTGYKVIKQTAIIKIVKAISKFVLLFNFL